MFWELEGSGEGIGVPYFSLQLSATFRWLILCCSRIMRSSFWSLWASHFSGMVAEFVE